MRNQEVRRPETKLNALDHKLACRLRKDVHAKVTAVPDARPPGAVRLIVLELTAEEQRDADLVHRTLDGDDRDDTQDSVRRVPEFQEPLQGKVLDQVSYEQQQNLRRIQRRLLGLPVKGNVQEQPSRMGTS